MSRAAIVSTGVEDTSAAHVELRTADDAVRQLTVVWSTLASTCSPLPGHVRTRLRPHEIPMLCDETGTGRWQVAAGVECECGRVVAPRVVLRSGHLRGAALRAVARRIAERRR